MRRFLIAGGAVLLATVLMTGQAGASLPRAHLKKFVCQRALDPPARAVSVSAVMRPLAGTRKMALRFELLSKVKLGGSFSAVSGGDLGIWIAPANPTLGQLSGDVWIFNKQVVDLAAPASYRLRVFFRWTGAHDRVLGTAVRDSPTCFQPELRPDLLVQSIAVVAIPGRPKMDRYVATIRNRGVTGAGSFEILFSPGGALPVQTKIVPGLAADTSTQREFIGPACSSVSAPTITVDPNNQIDDYDRSNNQMTAVCPPGLGP
jgi:hypothetical protein